MSHIYIRLIRRNRYKDNCFLIRVARINRYIDACGYVTGPFCGTIDGSNSETFSVVETIEIATSRHVAETTCSPLKNNSFVILHFMVLLYVVFRTRSKDSRSICGWVWWVGVVGEVVVCGTGVWWWMMGGDGGCGWWVGGWMVFG